VGLAWLLAQPGVPGPIVGPRTIEQFNSNLQALDVDLDAAALSELDAMFPGPGTAPEAWAW
jgi:aryl-alcohol dehydrogenase-like predicted oxidoreductase